MSLRTLYDEASLWMTPGGYEDGKLFSELPTDGSGDFTFSRGSNLAATRVDASQLIEKGRENLLYPSNLSSGFNTTRSSTTLNASDPYGGTEAIQFITNTDASTSHFLNKSVSISATSQVMTMSVTAKPNGYNFLRLEQGNNSRGATFELTGEGAIVSDDIAASIESIGNGWYRCSATFLSISTSVAYIISCMPTSSLIYTGDGVSGGFLYGAQLEQGLVATPYIETGASTAQAGILEDLPRLDYSGGATCPSLLLEPSRTNLITQSEYGAGASLSNMTATSNAATSPEGVGNATTFETGITGQCQVFQFFTAATGNHTGSVFLKKVDFDWAYMEVGGAVAWFNIGSGTLGNGSAYGSNWTYVDHSIVDYGNGWYRCTLIGNCINAGSYRFRNLQPVSSNGGYFSNLAGGDTHWYGAQVETGSYATSYIPTYGSSQTRAGDVCVNAGDAATFNSTEGVLYAEIAALADDLTSRKISLNSGTSINQVTISFSTGASNKIRSIIYDGSSVVVDLAFTDSNITLYNKIAIRYKSGDTQLWVNGVKVATNNSAFSGLNLSNLSFNSGSSEPFYGKTKQVLVFNEALTDSELTELTINGLKEELIAAYKTRVTTLEEGASERLDTYLQSLEDFIII